MQGVFLRLYIVGVPGCLSLFKFRAVSAHEGRNGARAGMVTE